MVFLTNRKLARRTFLRGLGTTLALPFLESMLPVRGAHAAAQKMIPTRFIGAFVPHGVAPGYWIPEKSTPGFAFPFVYEPLQPFRKHVVLTSGLWSKSSENPPGVTGADHFVAAAYLSAVKPKKTTGADIEAGTTVDQLIARKIGNETLLPSLQLGLEDPGANSTNCGEGYSCTYTNTISWQTPTRPLPMEINPQVVFERMFGDGSSPELRRASLPTRHKSPCRTACPNHSMSTSRFNSICWRWHFRRISLAWPRCSTPATSRAVCTRKAAPTSVSMAGRTMPRIPAALPSSRA